MVGSRSLSRELRNLTPVGSGPLESTRSSSPISGSDRRRSPRLRPRSSTLTPSRARRSSRSPPPRDPTASALPTTRRPSPLVASSRRSSVPRAASMAIRNQPVTFPGIDQPFPAPCEFDDVDPTDRQDAEIYARAPWFDRRCLHYPDLLRRYANDRDDLPGGIPVDATQTWTWRRHFSYVNSDLHVPRDRTLSGVKVEFAVTVNKGLTRIFTWDVPDAATAVDMFLYRTRGEIEYVARLQGITADNLESWRTGLTSGNPTYIVPGALRIHKPVIAVDFRFLKARNIRFIDRDVRNERRLRSLTGRIIPFHVLHHHCFRHRYLEEFFVGLNTGWKRLEVPRGCVAELPAVFSYKTSELLDPQSGWWVVAFTEWAAKVAGAVLGDVYDTFRLWYLPPLMIAGIRSLDLVTVLGNATNAAEMRRLLAVIEATDFSTKPDHWNERSKRLGTHAVEHSPGRAGNGADFIYYDPWHRRVISEMEAFRKSHATLVKPTDYPERFDYESPIPELSWEDVCGEVDQGTDDDEDGWGAAVQGANQFPVNNFGVPAALPLQNPGVSFPSMPMGQSMGPSVGMGPVPPLVAPSVVPGVPTFPQYGFPPASLPANMPMTAQRQGPVTPGGVPPYSAQGLPVMALGSMPPVPAPVPALTPQAQLESARAFLRMAGYADEELQGTYADLCAMIRGLRGE